MTPEELAGSVESIAEERRRSLVGLPVIDVDEPRRISRRGPFKKRQFALPLVALLVLASTLVAGPTEEPSVPVPAALIGWWNADDSRYVGRGFRIAPSTLTLHVPDSGPIVRPIQGVRVKQDGNDKFYEIDYGLEPETTVFSFEYSQDGAIRFPNQSGMVWKRGEHPEEKLEALVDSVIQTDGVSELPPGLAACIISVTSEQKSRSGPVSCVAEIQAWQDRIDRPDTTQTSSVTRP